MSYKKVYGIKMNNLKKSGKLKNSEFYKESQA